MSTNVNEIRYLVYHDPRPFKFMFKNPTEDKRRLSAIIGRMIPYRIGIEFELFGTLAHLSGIDPKQKKTHYSTVNRQSKVIKKLNYEDSVKKAMISKYNLIDYSEDKYAAWSEKDELEGNLNEIRISIKGTSQLTSLYNMCRLLNENCKIPLEKGGIHIHIDITDLIKLYPNAKNFAYTYLNRESQMAKVANIFGGYKGKYNKRGVQIGTKGYWINISNKNTIEFRIGSLNFNYQTIIRWIIELSKIVSDIKNYLCNNIPILPEELKTNKNENVDTVTFNTATLEMPWNDGTQLTSSRISLNDLSTSYYTYTPSGGTWL